MAVVFLNNLDLSGNQLLNARLQNLASDPGTANAGDVIYNTTSNVFKYYNGSSWVDPSTGSYTSWTLQGDSGSNQTITDGTTVDWAGGTGITTATTSNTLTIALDTASSTVRGGVELFSDTVQSVAGNAVSSTASRTYGVQLNSSKQAVVNVPWTDTASSVATASALGEIKLASDVTQDVAANTVSGTSSRTYGVQLNSSNQAVVNVPWTDNSGSVEYEFAASAGSASVVTAGGTVTFAQGTGITTTSNGSGTITIAATGSGSMSSFTLTGDSGSNQTISDSDTLDVAGGTNISTVVGATDTVTVNLDDSITLAGTLTVSGTGQSSFGGQVTVPTTPSATTDAASKAYVDSVVVGNLVFQGGYNAATNTPDLDSSPSASIKKGWAYVVTAAGSFFTETVEVGDFLISQQDAPTTLANWVTVQNNIDLATVSTVGIGNVNIDGAGAKDGLTLAYSSGTATVGLDIGSLPASGAVSTLDAANVIFPVYDDDATANQKITLQQIQQGISSSASASLTAASTVVTHNLGTRDLIIQLYDTVTYDTVYADVSRTSTNTITVIFAATPTNTVKCLIYSTEIQGV